MNERKKKICFLFGAGCEGNGQIGLPSGANFKKDIVLSKEMNSLYKKINNSNVKMQNSAIIDARCQNILYQTYKEHKDKLSVFSEGNKKIIEDYIKYREGKIETEDPKREEVKRKFKELYKTLIGAASDLKNSILVSDEEKNAFFENLTICSFSDELFNYLRFPNEYETEVTKVKKLYFSAYYSIIKKIYELAENKNFETEYLDINKNLDVLDFRKKFANDIESWQKKICADKKDDPNLYYNVIKKLYSFNQDKFEEPAIITTNYTNFAETLTEFKVSYLHGRIDLFEETNKKTVGELSKFTVKSEIFPFIFIPSGIKPIVCIWQMEQYCSAISEFKDSDLLCILGYSINSDDEHIQNFIHDRLNNGKRVVLFNYKAPDSKETKSNPFDSRIEIKNISDSQKDNNTFEKVLTELMKTL